jgi:hypothetical protein
LKLSKFTSLVTELNIDDDPEIVTGESWLPEELKAMSLHDNKIFLDFDNAPQDDEQDSRGLVEHELELVRKMISHYLTQDTTQQQRESSLLLLMQCLHEQPSDEVVEYLQKLVSAIDE